MTPKELVLEAFTAILINFDPAAAEKFLAPGYIQHNPVVPTGPAAILGFIPVLKESEIEVKTHRVIAEGDLVVLHNSYTNAQVFGAEQLVGFDVFRVENGQIIEHWDNLTPITPPNPSGHSQTDGPTEISDPGKTAENKALVTDFVNTILKRGEVDRITEFLSTETYIQHNSQIADGLDGLGAALAAMADQGIDMIYTDTHLVVAEGDFVFTASEGTLGGAPTAYFDLFRVADGKIVEHWDVISDIPSEMAHDNGKF